LAKKKTTMLEAKCRKLAHCDQQSKRRAHLTQNTRRPKIR
jgi:hypothetical protein